MAEVVVLVFLFHSVILLVNSICASLILNHHLINHIIISLTSALIQCYSNTLVCTHYKCSFKTEDFVAGFQGLNM